MGVPEQEAAPAQRPQHVPERHPQGGDLRDAREPPERKVQEPYSRDREPGPQLRPQEEGGPAGRAREPQVPPLQRPAKITGRPAAANGVWGRPSDQENVPRRLGGGRKNTQTHTHTEMKKP